MKIVFWNTSGKNVESVLEAAIKHMHIDLLVLAEYDERNNRFLDLVNQKDDVFMELPQIGCRRISIFYRNDTIGIEHGPESNYYTTKRISLTSGFQLLLVAVHLPSKLNQSNLTQTLEASEFKREIESAEETLGTKNTFVVGDFNMNPFEHGMIAASAFHSVPCEKIASAGSRVIKQREHHFFYNPMWNMFGDLNDNPGSFFHRDSEQSVYFWHILDQVIIRPSISKYFIKESLEILKKVDDISLVSDMGRPSLSDHLPIFFEFDFERGAENEEFVA